MFGDVGKLESHFNSAHDAARLEWTCHAAY
jgi:hypothetical protein